MYYTLLLPPGLPVAPPCSAEVAGDGGGEGPGSAGPGRSGVEMVAHQHCGATKTDAERGDRIVGKHAVGLAVTPVHDIHRPLNPRVHLLPVLLVRGHDDDDDVHRHCFQTVVNESDAGVLTVTRI